MYDTIEVLEDRVCMTFSTPRGVYHVVRMHHQAEWRLVHPDKPGAIIGDITSIQIAIDAILGEEERTSVGSVVTDENGKPYTKDVGIGMLVRELSRRGMKVAETLNTDQFTEEALDSLVRVCLVEWQPE